MQSLIKPTVLKQGDTIASVSLSWGGPGAFPQRYEYGKKQFEKTFGLKIVEAPHTLCPPEELDQHPEWRLEDLIWAFKNKEVKGILTTIGGDDTIRLLSLMTDKDFQIIQENPKVFLGMSDTTVNHFMCLPVVSNMDFGHTVPQMILPYGVLCEINPMEKTVFLFESGVQKS